MDSLSKRTLACALLLGGSLWPLGAAAQPTATIRHVAVLGAGNHVEVEITASQSITPKTQIVTGPDRLVIDFPNATLGSGLRNLSVNRGEVKDIRVGLFAVHPPVTRVVVDLKAPQSYQLFPSGKTLIVKLTASGTQPPTQPAIVSSAPAPPSQPAKPAPRVEVEFQNGELSIWADKATLAEVLNEVHQQTGAYIPIPAGADQEPVVADYAPAPAREVLAALLNGSRFNFIMVGSERGQLRSVLLTPRGEALPQSAVYSPPPAVAENVPDQVVQQMLQPDQAETPSDQPAPEEAPPQPQ